MMSMERIEMKANDLLIFLHIPKAAGSTIHHILAHQYPAEAVYSIEGDRVQESYDALRALQEDEKEQFSCIKGHLPFGVHEFFRGQSTYITFLRDPANWVRSYYTFILSIPAHPFHQEVAACQGLEEFCGLLTEWGMDDYQTRILAGTDTHDNILPPYGPLPENALEIAKSHIEAKIPVVGLVEQFDESLLLLKQHFGWKSVRYLKKNVTSGGPVGLTLTGPLKELIYKNNSRDLALYHYCRERLQTQMNQQGGEFRQQVNQFQTKNTLFARIYPWYMLLRLNRLKSCCCDLAKSIRGGR